MASVIYYYDTDEAIVDRGLNLRKRRTEDKDFPISEDYTHEVLHHSNSHCRNSLRFFP